MLILTSITHFEVNLAINFIYFLQNQTQVSFLTQLQYEFSLGRNKEF